MHARKWPALGLALLCLLLWVPIAAAQSGTVIIDDNGVDIDQSRIRNAAQPLANQGVRVVVITTQSGTEDYLNRKLQSLNIAQSSNGNDLPADVLIYFVSMNDRISGIYYGRNFNNSVGANAANLRENYLNAGLRNGDPTRGLVDIITQSANVLGTGASTNPGSSANPGIVAAPSSSDSDGGFGWILGLIVAGGLGLFLVPKILSSRSNSKSAAGQLQDAQSRYAKSRQQAGAAISDIAAQFRDATEKQRFDSVSYPSTQAQELARRHKTVEKSFTDLQLKYDQAEEQADATPQPTVLNLEASMGLYDDISHRAHAVREEITAMDRLRKELDQISAQAPGEVDRVKKF